MTRRWRRTGSACRPATRSRNAGSPRCSDAPPAAGREPESPMHGKHRRFQTRRAPRSRLEALTSSRPADHAQLPGPRPGCDAPAVARQEGRREPGKRRTWTVSAGSAGSPILRATGSSCGSPPDRVIAQAVTCLWTARYYQAAEVRAPALHPHARSQITEIVGVRPDAPGRPRRRFPPTRFLARAARRPSAAISARPWAAIAAARAAPVSSANCSSSPVQIRMWPACTR